MKAFLLFGLVASLPLLAGCSSDCTSAFDCAYDEVCYQSVCTPASASYLACSGDEDCNGGAEGPFSCRGGRCILDTNTTPAADGGSSSDAGPAPGPMDSGMTTPVDSGMMTPVDSGMMTPVDSGGMASEDSGMMTPVDAGVADTGPSDIAQFDAGPPGTGVLTATVDGAMEDFSSFTSAAFDAAVSNSMIILGESATGEILSVYFSNPATGVYSCVMSTASLLVTRGGQGFTANNLQGSCDVEVTSIGAVGDPVVGTFSGTLDNGQGTQVSITNGQFNIPRS